MIQEVKMFTVVCDSCGKDVCQNAEYSAWNEKRYAEDVAMESDWLKDNDKHYCPDCFTYNDEDNLVVKSEFICGAKSHLT